MKKIYFACSIRGGRADQPIYEQIVEIIKAQATLLSELFGDKNLTEQGHTDLSNHAIWLRDLGWLEESDAAIVEVTNPSLGVGYEIAKAKEFNKPVLALYRPQPDKRLSAMVAGDPNVKVVEYQDAQELKAPINAFLQKL